MVEPHIIEGRECGTCTLCCKVMSISELAKPQGQWCRHCDVGRGCQVYVERPQECRSFLCGYLIWRELGEHWHPARSKMVVIFDHGGNRLLIRVDPGRPSVWRQEPYFSEIKRWAASITSARQQIVVAIGQRTIVIFPDREVDLGIVSDDERIVAFEKDAGAGSVIEVVKIKANDPRIAGMPLGKLI